jgi:single-strand DNA-binding protein
MASLNRVLLIGNLTRSPELRHTSNGIAVADMRLAVNRQYTSQSGEKRSEATFLTVVVWGKQAEASAQHLSKGSAVFIEGRIQIREWDGKDGQKRTATEIIADTVQFLSPRKAEDADDPRPASDSEAPF